MRYVHIKNIEKYHPDISSEAHLEKFILSRWDEFFSLSFIAKRKKISKRSIIDILAKSSDENFVIELKFRPIRKSDRKQLRRYLRDLGAAKGILVGYNHRSGKIEVVL